MERPPIGDLHTPPLTVVGVAARQRYVGGQPHVELGIDTEIGNVVAPIDAGDAADLAVQIVDALSDDLADSVRQRIGAGTRAGAA